MTASVLILTVLLGDPGPPRIVLDEAGTLGVALSPTLFDVPEIDRRLGSGLTTTLLITVDLRDEAGNKGRGAARVDIRFEPWDEAYHVRRYPFDRPPDASVRILSKTEMIDLLCEAELIVAELEPGGWQGRVVLEVLPYSDVEQEGAREWFARALAASDSGGAPNMFDRLYAASIKRHARERFTWEVAISP